MNFTLLLYLLASLLWYGNSLPQPYMSMRYLLFLNIFIIMSKAYFLVSCDLMHIILFREPFLCLKRNSSLSIGLYIILYGTFLIFIISKVYFLQLLLTKISLGLYVNIKSFRTLLLCKSIVILYKNFVILSKKLPS